MSHKAMWNNRNGQPAKRWVNSTCAGPECGVSVMTGTGIPAGLVQYTVTRHYRSGRMCKVPEYGQLMTDEQADRLNRETGRTKPYGRNVVCFVMSRAARKRGIVATDSLYLRRVARAGK